MQTFKHRIYFLMYLLASLASVMILAQGYFSEAARPLAQSLILTLGAAHLLMALAVARRWLSLPFVETLMLLEILVALLLIMAYELYQGNGGRSADVVLLTNYLWLPIFYLALFFVFESRRALKIALLMLVLLVCISLPHAILTWDGSKLIDGLTILGQVYISNAFMIAGVFFFAKLRMRMQRAEVEADVMRNLAYTDALTGLPNRRQLEAQLAEAIAHAGRYGRSLAVVLIDIDNFKLLNDSYGHKVGDRVLRQLAQMVRQNLRVSDVFGRWGGEEFLLLVPEADMPGALELAELIRLRVAAQTFAHHEVVTVSSGVAVYRNGDSVSRLLNRADSALYAAKGRGKNQVVDTKVTLF